MAIELNAPHAPKVFSYPKLLGPQTTILIYRSRPFCVVSVRRISSPSDGHQIAGNLGDEVDCWFARRFLGGGEARAGSRQFTNDVGYRGRTPTAAVAVKLAEAGPLAGSVAAEHRRRCLRRFYAYRHRAEPTCFCFDPGGLRIGRPAGLGISSSGLCFLRAVPAGKRSGPPLPLTLRTDGTRSYRNRVVLWSRKHKMEESSAQSNSFYSGRRFAGKGPDNVLEKLRFSSLEKGTAARAFLPFPLLTCPCTQGPIVTSAGYILFQLRWAGFWGIWYCFYHIKTSKSRFYKIWIYAGFWSFVGLWKISDLNFRWDPGGFGLILLVLLVLFGNGSYGGSGLGGGPVTSCSPHIWVTVDDALTRTDVFALEACLWIKLSGTTTVFYPGKRLWCLQNDLFQYRPVITVFTKHNPRSYRWKCLSGYPSFFFDLAP